MDAFCCGPSLTAKVNALIPVSDPACQYPRKSTAGASHPFDAAKVRHLIEPLIPYDREPLLGVHFAIIGIALQRSVSNWFAAKLQVA